MRNTRMKKAVLYEEKRILNEVAAGSEQAFSSIVKHYWNNIYSLAMMYLKSSYQAENIVQDVFLRIWQKRHTLGEVDRFEAYLFIIARNIIISELRKKLSEPVQEEFPEKLSEENSLPGYSVSVKELNRLISNAIAALPQQQKAAFLLSRDEGLSYEEIATTMGLSKETVKKHIVRALNFLRTYIRMYAETMIPFICWPLLNS